MTSTRLPGKVLLPLGDKTVLGVLVERASQSKYVDEIVVATTINQTDQPIVDFCAANKIKYFRGSENDVLSRVLGAAEAHEADLICELMGDSPFVDPIIIDQVITSHLAGNYDYTATFWPYDTFPMGFAVQIFPTSVLAKAAELTDDPIDHVHVSCFIYHHPEIFRLNGLRADWATHAPDLRLCIDTQEDYEAVDKVFSLLSAKNKNFGAKEAVKYLRDHPESVLINKNVKQKNINEG